MKDTQVLLIILIMAIVATVTVRAYRHHSKKNKDD